MKRYFLLALLGLVATLPATSVTGAEEDADLESIHSLVESQQGVEWEGTSELWTDPMGNNAMTGGAALRVESNGLTYTWEYEGQEHVGRLLIDEVGVEWKDTWHQSQPVQLDHIASSNAIFSAEYNYPTEAGPDWRWRIQLSQRPDGTLVFQMINITPWGEEGRAARMIFDRKAADS